MTEEVKTVRAVPKVSIIIVTLNAAGYLQRCLDSIYRQVYSNLEIVVMDGRSTDDTVAIIKANENKLALWKSEKDGGIYDAMNKAVQHITGEWVYFLGADDEMLEDFSNLAYQLNNKTHIYYGRVYISGKLTRGGLNAYKHAKDTICHQAIIYPASVFTKYKFDTRFKIAADHVLNMQCWADDEYLFEFVDLPVAIFNDTGISMTRHDNVFDAAKSGLIFKYYGLAVWLRFNFRQFKERLFPYKYPKGF